MIILRVSIDNYLFHYRIVILLFFFFSIIIYNYNMNMNDKFSKKKIQFNILIVLIKL